MTQDNPAHTDKRPSELLLRVAQEFQDKSWTLNEVYIFCALFLNYCARLPNQYDAMPDKETAKAKEKS